MTDPETCSLCLTEVEFSTLREVIEPNKVIYEGALVCRQCRIDHLLNTRKVT